MENELIALQPNSFKIIQRFFTKLKSLALQCKQCGIKRKDEQLVLFVLSKLGSEYSDFVSTFHFIRDYVSNWKIPCIDMFVDSLIHEQDNLVQMRVLQTSKNQSILMSDPTNSQAKGKHKGKEPKASDLKTKESKVFQRSLRL